MMVGLQVQEKLAEERKEYTELMRMGCELVGSHNHKIKIADEAIKESLLQFQEYFHNKALPSIDLVFDFILMEGVTEINKVKAFITKCHALQKKLSFSPDSLKYYLGGTTLTLATIIGENVWAANIGDSRIVAVPPHGKFLQLTEDATLEKGRFLRGYEQRGGSRKWDSVGHVWRTRGGLMIPRSLGETGDDAISVRASVTKYVLLQGETFLVLACDGLFDVLSSNEVGEIVRLRKKGEGPKELSERLVQAAFAQGSDDNISAMVVSLLKKGDKKTGKRGVYE